MPEFDNTGRNGDRPLRRMDVIALTAIHYLYVYSIVPGFLTYS